jgi:hypothetical protein
MDDIDIAFEILERTARDSSGEERDELVDMLSRDQLRDAVGALAIMVIGGLQTEQTDGRDMQSVFDRWRMSARENERLGREYAEHGRFISIPDPNFPDEPDPRRPPIPLPPPADESG